MKRVLSLILALVMLTSLGTSVFANNEEIAFEEDPAEEMIFALEGYTGKKQSVGTEEYFDTIFLNEAETDGNIPSILTEEKANIYIGEESSEASESSFTATFSNEFPGESYDTPTYLSEEEIAEEEFLTKPTLYEAIYAFLTETGEGFYLMTEPETIVESMTIPQGFELAMSENGSLTIAPGAVLTVEGGVSVSEQGNASILNYGTIVLEETASCSIPEECYSGNMPIFPQTETEYTEETLADPEQSPTINDVAAEPEEETAFDIAPTQENDSCEEGSEGIIPEGNQTEELENSEKNTFEEEYRNYIELYEQYGTYADLSALPYDVQLKIKATVDAKLTASAEEAGEEATEETTEAQNIPTSADNDAVTETESNDRQDEDSQTDPETEYKGEVSEDSERENSEDSDRSEEETHEPIEELIEEDASFDAMDLRYISPGTYELEVGETRTEHFSGLKAYPGYMGSGSSSSDENVVKITGRGEMSFTYQAVSPGTATVSYWVTSYEQTHGDTVTNSGQTTFIVVPAGYTVTYDANGGTGAPSSQKKTEGSALTLSATRPTRPGYTFQGWATSSTATKATYQPGGSYTNNSSITLYAVWKFKAYVIRYSANGGSGAPDYQEKSKGATVKLSTVKPTRAGYTFLGWATEPSSYEVAYKPGASYSTNKNLNLYAIWIATPTLTGISSTLSSVTVTWGQVNGATTYRVFRKTGSGKWTKIKDTTKLSFTDKTVIGGTKYSYTVRCLSSDGKNYISDYDKTGLSVMFYSLSQPKLTSVSNVSNGVTVKWGKVSGAEKYRVFRKTGNSSWTKLADTTAVSYTDTSVKNNTRYTYTVRCLSSDGSKYPSQYDTKGLAITYTLTVAAPKISDVNNVNGGVAIKWGKVTGASKYRVFRKTGNSSWAKIADTTAATYTDKTAVSGTIYTYTVRCISSDGKSYASSYDTTGKTITYIAAPVLKTLIKDIDSVAISWKAVSGAEKYRIFRKTANGNWTKIKDTAAVSYTDRSVISGNTYSYTVRCISSDGNTYISAYDTKGLTVSYVEGVAIDKTNFPDDVFRSYIADNIDRDGDLYLSKEEIADTTEINCYKMGISSLGGIKWFSNLEWLYCYGNNLSTIDLRGLSKLTDLACGSNNLSSLDLSSCVELEDFSCSFNDLVELDLTHCPQLKYVSCSDNNLERLKIGDSIISLDCNSNQLKELDTSSLIHLEHLICYGNYLESLVLNNSLGLRSLYCTSNKLLNINLSGCSELTNLDIERNNSLSELNLNGCASLEKLNAGGYKLTSLDVRGCSGLQVIWCGSNMLTSLDLSGCSSLKKLFCANNSITEIDISECPTLIEVYQKATPEYGTYTYYAEYVLSDVGYIQVDADVNIIC